MEKRRNMRGTDWLNGLTIIVIGVFIGLALDLLFQLRGAAFWIMAIGTPVLMCGIFLFDSIIDGVINRLFPSGFKKTSNSQVKERKPLVLLLSLPAGIVMGIIGAQLGLGEVLL